MNSSPHSTQAGGPSVPPPRALHPPLHFYPSSSLSSLSTTPSAAYSLASSSASYESAPGDYHQHYHYYDTEASSVTTPSEDWEGQYGWRSPTGRPDMQPALGLAGSSAQAYQGNMDPTSNDANVFYPIEAGSERRMCECGKSFRRPSDLAKHKKYHIKFYSCLHSGCDRAFATQKDLTRHLRTHYKGPGWQCNVEGCRKAAMGHVYTRKDNFDRHMRTAHWEN